MRLASAAFAILAAATVAGAARADCLSDQVEFRTTSGVARFSVEIAATEAQREYGLMDRDHLAAAAGMLFVFPEPVHAMFWMKDTRIPLDMIFADPAGRVTHVAANARPMDQTVIDGGDGVRFVVEINGGLARSLGIAPGALMRSPEVNQQLAAWPCTAP